MMMLATNQDLTSPHAIRVMVVDDCPATRGRITKALEMTPHIKVVATACNGKAALTMLQNIIVDVITLDIDMPGMGGLEALPQITEHETKPHVVLVSSLDLKNTAYGPALMHKFGVPFLRKPRNLRDICDADDFVSRLLQAVVTAGPLPRDAGASLVPQSSLSIQQRPLQKIELRSNGTKRPKVIAISSSTGGPPVLKHIIGALGPQLGVPILITQHIMAKFTSQLAGCLNDFSQLNCQVARDGDLIQAGHAYLAPGNFHMQIKKHGTDCHIALSNTPPENFCKPAADPMLRSLVECYGGAVLSVVLTGMGHDGCAGSQQVIEHGGTVIAQNEASSSVWGMPGAVSKAGLCSAVLPFEDIAQKIKFLVSSS